MGCVREDLEGAGEVEGVEVGVGGEENFEGVGCGDILMWVVWDLIDVMSLMGDCDEKWERGKVGCLYLS